MKKNFFQVSINVRIKKGKFNGMLSMDYCLQSQSQGYCLKLFFWILFLASQFLDPKSHRGGEFIYVVSLKHLIDSIYLTNFYLKDQQEIIMQQSQIQILFLMKRVLPKQKGDKISGRANSKGATINNRHYIIGGLSQQGPQTSIHSFVITSKNPYQIQWRKQQIKNIELFTLRHSFSIAAIGKSIYIFGGDDMNNGQSIGELLKYDVEKQEMSKVETKGDAPPTMNSMTLSANQESKELVLFGGVHSNEKTPFGLYFLDLTSLVWRFKQLSLECYDQGIWQHTAHLINKPLIFSSTDNLKLNPSTKKQNIIGLDLGIKENQEKTLAHKIAKINIGEQEINQQLAQAKQQLKQQKSITLTQKQQYQGPFLAVVGGCFHPNHPYSEITQIDVHSGSIVSQSFVSPVTGHQSVLYKDQLFVFGGSDGTAPTQSISIIKEQIKEQKGFSGIGPTGFVGENEVIIFGGINVLTSPPTFNNVLILYED